MPAPSNVGPAGWQTRIVRKAGEYLFSLGSDDGSKLHLDACIITAGFGQTRPIASNNTAPTRQKNRRVEMRLLKASTPEKQ